MKKIVITLATAIILMSAYTVNGMTLLEKCPTVVIKAEKQFTREEVLKAVYEQTEMWKISGEKVNVSAPTVKKNPVVNYNFKWSILDNKVIK